MDETLFKELSAVEEAFNRAVISNDVAAISSCISEDWTLVTPEVGPVSRDGFLHAVGQGILSHDSMTKDILRVRVYGNVAVVTGRGRNTGIFKGAPISADEWITDVYVKTGDRWICTLTHLTPVAS
ncbi:nuclear transport factor 2 family protein [Methylocystis sp. H62]|uniref:nuclear transport factor 2 family protein n=1 Tax=Methylocystis sp. H62 TaxID=2785789 RepID=UPI0018C1E8C3|nr:nuclear transport factor 2 family protein [Methylocystis sp. H62]MBG0792425.1 nuclear transport factor 2 family protein [Methylocystis sp. H62]MBG0792925.1 nuclear transport factor 2 family protein [Methylocystis sp. H62]